MADNENKVEDEAQEPAAEQVERVGQAEKAQAEAIEALPKVEAAEVPKAEKTAAKPSQTPKDYSPRLKRDFEERIVPAMTERFGYKNRLEVPRLDKIVVNMGVGEATQNAKVLDPAVRDLGEITGQKPVVTRAKKSIAAFKVRENMPIGAMVTLRGDRMYEFFDRLVNTALPRVRDFRGVSTKSFDGRGNYTLGLKDQLVFPEIDYAKVDKLKGMNITIVTTAKNDNEARSLLKLMGMPFRTAQ